MDPFRKVTKLALGSEHRCRHGALITRGRKLLGEGINKSRTHPKSSHPYSAIHAEFDAINKAKESLEGATLYVARVLASGELAMSKPCEHCQRAIEEAGIATVVYSDENGNFIEMR